MKRILVMMSAVGLVFGFLFVSGVPASQTDAKALVEEAATFAETNGKEAAIKELSRTSGRFDKGELYVFAYDMSATMVAHPKNPKLIGKNLMDVPDTDGKLFRKEIVETAGAKGSGWVDYKYKNPDTNKVEAKTTYFLKVGDIVLCCGTYK